MASLIDVPLNQTGHWLDGNADVVAGIHTILSIVLQNFLQTVDRAGLYQRLGGILPQFRIGGIQTVQQPGKAGQGIAGGHEKKASVLLQTPAFCAIIRSPIFGNL